MSFQKEDKLSVYPSIRLEPLDVNKIAFNLYTKLLIASIENLLFDAWYSEQIDDHTNVEKAFNAALNGIKLSPFIEKDSTHIKILNVVTKANENYLSRKNKPGKAILYHTRVSIYDELYSNNLASTKYFDSMPYLKSTNIEIMNKLLDLATKANEDYRYEAAKTYLNSLIHLVFCMKIELSSLQKDFFQDHKEIIKALNEHEEFVSARLNYNMIAEMSTKTAEDGTKKREIDWNLEYNPLEIKTAYQYEEIIYGINCALETAAMYRISERYPEAKNYLYVALKYLNNAIASEKIDYQDSYSIYLKIYESFATYADESKEKAVSVDFAKALIPDRVRSKPIKAAIPKRNHIHTKIVDLLHTAVINKLLNKEAEVANNFTDIFKVIDKTTQRINVPPKISESTISCSIYTFEEVQSLVSDYSFLSMIYTFYNDYCLSQDKDSAQAQKCLRIAENFKTLAIPPIKSYPIEALDRQMRSLETFIELAQKPQPSSTLKTTLDHMKTLMLCVGSNSVFENVCRFHLEMFNQLDKDSYANKKRTIPTNSLLAKDDIVKYFTLPYYNVFIKCLIRKVTFHLQEAWYCEEIKDYDKAKKAFNAVTILLDFKSTFLKEIIPEEVKRIVKARYEQFLSRANQRKEKVNQYPLNSPVPLHDIHECISIEYDSIFYNKMTYVLPYYQKQILHLLELALLSENEGHFESAKAYYESAIEQLQYIDRTKGKIDCKVYLCYAAFLYRQDDIGNMIKFLSKSFPLERDSSKFQSLLDPKNVPYPELLSKYTWANQEIEKLFIAVSLYKNKELYDEMTITLNNASKSLNNDPQMYHLPSEYIYEAFSIISFGYSSKPAIEETFRNTFYELHKKFQIDSNVFYYGLLDPKTDEKESCRNYVFKPYFSLTASIIRNSNLSYHDDVVKLIHKALFYQLVEKHEQVKSSFEAIIKRLDVMVLPLISRHVEFDDPSFDEILSEYQTCSIAYKLYGEYLLATNTEVEKGQQYLRISENFTNYVFVKCPEQKLKANNTRATDFIYFLQFARDSATEIAPQKNFDRILTNVINLLGNVSNMNQFFLIYEDWFKKEFDKNYTREMLYKKRQEALDEIKREQQKRERRVQEEEELKIEERVWLQLYDNYSSGKSNWEDYVEDESNSSVEGSDSVETITIQSKESAPKEIYSSNYTNLNQNHAKVQSISLISPTLQPSLVHEKPLITVSISTNTGIKSTQQKETKTNNIDGVTCNNPTINSNFATFFTNPPKEIIEIPLTQSTIKINNNKVITMQTLELCEKRPALEYRSFYDSILIAEGKKLLENAKDLFLKDKSANTKDIGKDIGKDIDKSFEDAIKYLKPYKSKQKLSELLGSTYGLYAHYLLQINKPSEAYINLLEAVKFRYGTQFKKLSPASIEVVRMKTKLKKLEKNLEIKPNQITQQEFEIHFNALKPIYHYLDAHFVFSKLYTLYGNWLTNKKRETEGAIYLKIGEFFGRLGTRPSLSTSEEKSGENQTYGC